MAPPFRGPANSDGLAAGTGGSAGALRLAAPSADLAVQLPGEKPPAVRSVRCIERAGQPGQQPGAALLGLESGQPQRYVVVPGPPCAAWLMGWAREMNLEHRALHRQDPEISRVDLQAGLQNFRGNQGGADGFSLPGTILGEQG